MLFAPFKSVKTLAFVPFAMQIVLQLTHPVGTLRKALQTGPVTLAHSLLLPVSLTTNKAQLAVVVMQLLEIELQKQDLLLICGLWHAHQHFTNCWGCKNLLNALLTLFLRTLPIVKCTYKASAEYCRCTYHDLNLLVLSRLLVHSLVCGTNAYRLAR